MPIEIYYPNIYQTFFPKNFFYGKNTMMSVWTISIKKCFGGFGVCCYKFGNFIPFGKVCEQLLHDGSRLLYINIDSDDELLMSNGSSFKVLLLRGKIIVI